MKHMSLNILSCLLLTLALFTFSCSKEGPEGAQGEQGPAGPAGPAGSKGDKGDPGTANVIYSAWLDVIFQPSDTIHNDDGSIDTVGYYGEIEAPKLTEDILSKGEIKVYVNLYKADTAYITPIPYFDGLFNLLPVYSAGYIGLSANYDVFSTFSAGGVKYQQYRYILIPGGTAARTAAVDWNNYAAVKAYLKLKD